MSINVTLEKQDLINLVSGTQPSYSLFNNPIVRTCGSYTGGHSDMWTWGSGLNKLSEGELWSLYKLITKK